MVRSSLAGVVLVLAVAATNSFAQPFLEEFEWSNVSPSGTAAWMSASNWIAPSSPPGNPDYPDDPLHEDTDPEVIGPVVGANLSVALTSNLNVSLGGDITIASLVMGVDDRETTISGPGRLLFEHDEQNFVEEIPDPDDPTQTVDQYTCAFNCGVAKVTSGGNSAVNNVISAVVGSTESIDFTGTQTLTLAGGFEEVAVDPLDTSVANNTVLRSHFAAYDPALPIENQPRLLITGVVTTVVDEVLDASNEPYDIPLWINGGASGTPEILAPGNTQLGTGYQHGIIDLPGGITGAGDVAIGTLKREEETLPLPTVVLYDNSHTGGTLLNRGNVILRHNNAFGTGDVRNGNPANEVGYNLIVQPGPGETPATVNRVITNNIEIPHDWTVKGEHSLTLTGDNFASNSAGWVNLLPDGEQLLLTGRQFAETGNIFTYDGSGLTRIEGQLRNSPDDMIDTGTDPNGGRPGGQIRKRGTGAVYVESSLNGITNTLRLGDVEVDEDKDATVIVEGGNLHFATVGDMGDPAGRIESRGGAVGLDDGTIVGPGAATFMAKLGNFANRDIPSPEGDVESFRDYDNGGLMLAQADANANLDFTGPLANAQDMTVAAPETGLTFTGTITPANNTYRLGGGSGTLTVSGANKLTGANDLVITNGGDYRNPNGEDRIQLGMVQLSDTHNYSGSTKIIGKYQRTLQDQASRDDVAVGEVLSRGGPEELQYNGTTLAVGSLADGNSSIGTSTAAADLLIQGSTLRYEGAAGSTNRLFTVGTAGATLDASGSGAISFTNTSSLVMDVATTRNGSYLAFEGESLFRIYGLSDTEDLVIGMPISGGDIPPDSVITEILSPTRVLISNAFQVFDIGTDESISFGAVERTLAFTGTNTGDNTLAPLITDASDGGVVSLEKNGTGKWILEADNTYSGTTAVNEGTLLVNGVHSGGGGYTVAAGAVLGGDGTVGGNLAAAGTVAPGTSAGTLNITGDSTHESGSSLEIELGGTGSAYDVLDVSGVLTLNDATINVTLINNFQPQAGNVFDIFDFASAAGTYSINLPLNPADWDTSQLLIDGTLSFSGGGGVTGDFNNDGNWDCLDINALTAEIAMSGDDLSFDMNGDGSITLEDITAEGSGWLAVGGANSAVTGGNAFLVGDANLDGSVDVSDFNLWNGNKFTSVPEWCSGDFNADGAIDVSDFNAWNGNKFTSSASASVIPEPTALGMLLLAFAGGALVLRRRCERA